MFALSEIVNVFVPAPPSIVSKAPNVATVALNVSLPAPPTNASVLVVSDLKHAFISC